MKLVAHIEGDPVGQPRARCVPNRRTPVSTVSKKVKAYRTHLIGVLKREAKASGWVKPELFRCDIEAFWGTPVAQRWGRYCGKKPDRDNIDKLVLDCAQRAGVIPDDARAVAGGITKRWSQRGGVLATFEPVEGAPDDSGDDDDLGAFQVSS
jgi:Holliday junction resolvase RusA-like endonuclease